MYRAWCDHDEGICIIIWFLGMNLPGVSLKWSTFENEEQWREMTFQKKKNKKNQSIHVVSIYGIRGGRTHNQYSRLSPIDWLSSPLHNQSPSPEYRKERQIVTWGKNQTEIIISVYIPNNLENMSAMTSVWQSSHWHLSCILRMQFAVVLQSACV